MFTADQIEYLKHVGVRVEPHTNNDGTPNQVAINDRAEKAEKRLLTLRTMLKNWEREEQEDRDEGEPCFIDPDHAFGVIRDCISTGWYRCRECARYIEVKEE